jgi:hypothetical protein
MYELTVYQEVVVGPDEVHTDVLLKERHETRPTLDEKDDAILKASLGLMGGHKVFTSVRKIKEDIDG